MLGLVRSAGAWTVRARQFFVARDILFHDGRTMRRISVGGGRQAAVAAIAAVTVGFSGYGLAQAAYGTATATGLVESPAGTTDVAAMEQRVEAMEARVGQIRRTAARHAARVEQRQALLAAALTGQGDAQRLALATLAIEPAHDRTTAQVVAPFARIEARQGDLAAMAQAVLDRRLAGTNAGLRKMGLRPDRLARASRGGMGGPLIEADSDQAVADLKADQQFRTLFRTWKKMDTLQQGTIAIPSVQPVSNLLFTSNFGIRSDPFRGTAAMHAGVDIPGPTGTPIYATADGIVSNADRQGGYGNMVEINHGKGIATRYGHLSKMLVSANGRVTRGQLIGLMGSTGRSTGPHLHYEVRIDGRAVNPVPFLTTADYLLAAQDRAVGIVPVSTSIPAALD